MDEKLSEEMDSCNFQANIPLSIIFRSKDAAVEPSHCLFPDVINRSFKAPQQTKEFSKHRFPRKKHITIRHPSQRVNEDMWKSTSEVRGSSGGGHKLNHSFDPLLQDKNGEIISTSQNNAKLFKVIFDPNNDGIRKLFPITPNSILERDKFNSTYYKDNRLFTPGLKRDNQKNGSVKSNQFQIYMKEITKQLIKLKSTKEKESVKRTRPKKNYLFGNYLSKILSASRERNSRNHLSKHEAEYTHYNFFSSKRDNCVDNLVSPSYEAKRNLNIFNKSRQEKRKLWEMPRSSASLSKNKRPQIQKKNLDKILLAQSITKEPLVYLFFGNKANK